MSLNERIIALSEEVNDFLSKDIPIGSEEFIQLATSVLNYSDLASHLDHLAQEERKESEFEWIWKENPILNVVAPISAPIAQPQIVIPPPQQIKPNSLLIDVQKHWQWFKTWFNGLDFELTLLYRGSEQEFTNANFANLVGGQGPTLHIIKSEHDHIFGGCAFEKYPQSNSNKQDDKAFLFQLHPNQVMLNNKLDASYKNYALYFWNDSLSMFGSGVALRIYEPKNGKKSYTNYTGDTYEMPPGCNKEQAKSYLAGSYQFTIKEIEVFLITFK